MSGFHEVLESQEQTHTVKFMSLIVRLVPRFCFTQLNVTLCLFIFQQVNIYKCVFTLLQNTYKEKLWTLCEVWAEHILLYLDPL